MNKPILLSDIVGDLRADAAAAWDAARAGRSRGPATGLPALDYLLGGYLAPGLHVLQAAPGAGKTAFALQVAAECGFPALFVSAEMSCLELFRRTIARVTGTYLGRLKSGELDPDEVERLARHTAAHVPNLALLDAVTSYADPGLIRDSVDALKERTGAPHALIVLDSLHAWAMGGRGGSAEYDAINAALSVAGQIAGECASPLLVVAHRNRVGQERGGLHTAKGSGTIEYAAETVLELAPPELDTMDAGDRTIIATLHKNRHGYAGTRATLRFSGRLQRYTESSTATSTETAAPVERLTTRGRGRR